MVRLRATHIIACLAVACAVSALSNITINDVDQEHGGVETRRRSKKGKYRSTSSSSGEKSVDGSTKDKDSLDLSTSASSSSSNETKKKGKKYRPKSTEERTGWRKWHRKCHPCHDDMVMKWRNPAIKWICGGYQRARRSFKSSCMMHYRNCQDGTMFVELHKHRCENDTKRAERPHGEHFLYDYKAPLSGDQSSGGSKTKSSSDDSSSSSFEWRRRMDEPRPPPNITLAAKLNATTKVNV